MTSLYLIGCSVGGGLERVSLRASYSSLFFDGDKDTEEIKDVFLPILLYMVHGNMLPGLLPHYLDPVTRRT